MNEEKDNLTAVYYTANNISDKFAQATQNQLLEALEGIPLISVSHKPMDFGENIVVDLPRHHLSIYRQALIGAKKAKTKHIACVEDDVLYVPEHFKYRPTEGKFAYNVGVWRLQTWGEPVFTQKLCGRIGLHGLICERELFIEAMEERFAKWTDDMNLGNWGEPGKYERNLGVTIREIEKFYTNPTNIVFIHETALAFENLGKRKKIGDIRALTIPKWGTAKKIKELYD